MSHFVDPSDREELVCPSGVRVWVKRHLSVGDKAYVDQQAFEITADGKIKTDFAGFRLAVLKACVVEWEFTDGKGEAVPVSHAAIERLDAESEDVDWLLGEVARRFPLTAGGVRSRNGGGASGSGPKSSAPSGKADRRRASGSSGAGRST